MDALLTMHSIDESGSVLSLGSASFERLVDGLIAQDVLFVSMDDLAESPGPTPRHRVVLTFDDGMESVHARALPLLEERGITATAYIVANWTGADNGWPTQPAKAPRFPLMDWSRIRDLRDAGWEIGSHGSDHLPFTSMGEEAWSCELQGSQRKIEDHLQVPVRHLAYPYGVASREARTRAAALYRTAVSTEMAYLRPGSDWLHLPRIDSYYLRHWAGPTPLFGLHSRAHLRVRAGLRRLRRWRG
jgi:peptidoglycan/xylan/chitin deacetylase (PgdA/CDA1 family)